MQCFLNPQRKAMLGLAQGQTAVVTEITGPEDERHRLEEMGVVPGARLMVVARMPFGGPIIAQFEGWKLAIGRRLARHVVVSHYFYRIRT